LVKIPSVVQKLFRSQDF